MRAIRVRSARAVLVGLTALAAVLSFPAVVRQVDGRWLCDGEFCHCGGVGVSVAGKHLESSVCPFKVLPGSTGVEINA